MNIDLRASGNFVTGTNGFKIQGGAWGDQLGISVSNLGDINGDGIDDFIVGASQASPNGLSTAGEAYVIFGKGVGSAWTDLDLRTSGGNFVTGTNGFKIKGGAADDWLGYSVSNLGDINGDGVDDFIVGAWRADPNGLDRAGEAYVIFGKRAGSSWNDLDLRPTASGGNFVTGTNGFKIKGGARVDQLGVSVSNLEDINGDGVDDFIVGAYAADPNGLNDAGEAYVIFGKGTGSTWQDVDLRSSGGNFVTGTTGFKIQGGAGDDYLGSSASNLGDINGDGIDDFIVGAFAADPNGLSEAGEAYVIFGKGTGSAWTDLHLRPTASGGNFVTGTNGFKIIGGAVGDWLGYSVSNLGDINGDGIDDFIVGAYAADPNGLNAAGEAYVIFGKGVGSAWTDLDLRPTASGGNFVTGTNGFKIQGGARGDALGYSVSNLGDINGDGIDDFIVGAYWADPNGLNAAGEAYVIFGKPMGQAWSDIDLRPTASGGNFVTGSTGFKIQGRDGNDYLGYSVSNLGDINGDGIDDFIVGARQADPNGLSAAGEAYVIFGTCLSSNYELPNISSFSRKICTASSHIVDMDNIVSNLTITSKLTSQTGKIDLSGSYTTLTLNSATLKADSYTGTGDAIDLSGAASLIFAGTNTLDAGTSGQILLPPMSRVTGTPSTVVGTIVYRCNDGAYEIPVGTTYADDICYTQNITDTTARESNLTITADIESDTGKIDLSGSYNSLTLNGVRFFANNYSGTGSAIDLSGTSSLVLVGSNTLDAGTRMISLPSGFRISGPAPTTTGIVNYAVESGDYAISATPLAFPASATGAITTSLTTLTISDNLTSTTSKIDLTGASTALTIDGATLSAASYTGTGASVDLSGIASLTFSGTNAINAGTGYVLFPQTTAIAGTLPTITGVTCYDSAYTIAGDITSTLCYDDAFTTTVGNTALIISNRLWSLTNKIDLTGAMGTVTFSGATLDANGFTGSGADVDVSRATSVVFSGAATNIDVGVSGYVLLPASSAVTFTTMPTVTGTLCYDQAYVVSGNIVSTSCYDDAITSNLGSTALSITDTLWSLTNRIDLTGVAGVITLNGATLRANGYSGSGHDIDLSQADSLTFTGMNTLDAGTDGMIFLPPSSRITGTPTTVIGTIVNRCTVGTFDIPAGSTFANDVCYTQNIVDSVTRESALTITSTIESDTGRIDLSGNYNSLTLNGVTFSAINYSGQGAAIDLSGTSSLVFIGNNILNAGAGAIALPSGFRVSGSVPTTTGTVNYAIEASHVITLTPITYRGVATGDITTSLTTLVVSEDITSMSGKIDLTGSTTLTINGVTLSASSYTGTGASIDLSTATSLTFSGTNSLNAGMGYVLLPQASAVSGTLPTITGITCYDSAHIISNNVSSTICYDDAITTNVGTTALSITDRIWSLSNRIDLSGATGSVTLNGATLEADSYTGSQANAIDLSDATSLIFSGTNTLDAGTKAIALPSGFKILGIAPTTTGAVTYATESGNYIISATPLAFPSSATGVITTSLTTLIISDSLTSTTNKIDLTGASTSLTISGATLIADSYSGTGTAINLSGITNLTFSGINSLDVGTGYVLLPQASAISGTLPTITGVTCYDSAHIVSSNVSSTICYDDAITTNIGTTALSITDRIWSLTNRIDLSGATGAITLNGATLEADSYTGSQASAIDLSDATSLIFSGANTLDAGTKTIALPSGFRISGAAPTATGIITYATESGNYVIASTPVAYQATATGNISTSLTTLVISDDITSTGGNIDLTATTLSISGARLIANSYTGSGASINLSAATTLTFSGTNTLDAGTGYVLLPQANAISGTLPTITGITCYDSVYTISSNVSSITCYDDAIITNIGATALSITGRIWSLSNRIDLSGATGSVTLNGATLEADSYTGSQANVIDLSDATSLIFSGTNTLDAGTKAIDLPSGFKISGIAPTTTGTVTYATESGNYIISATPLAFPSSATGVITTSLMTLNIFNNLTSTNNKIDLTGSSASLTLSGATLSASNYTGTGASVDLSGIASLTFSGANTINVGSGYVLLPQASAISGTSPTVIGTTCYDSDYVIAGNIFLNTLCYDGFFTTNVGNTSLFIAGGTLFSLTNRIDLTGATGAIEFDNATIRANRYTGSEVNSIDLSNASSLTFRVTTFDAGSKGILFPSGFRISGAEPTTTGTVSYATELGSYVISDTPIAYPSTATGDVSTSLTTLVISDDITSTGGKIDLSSAITSLTINDSTLSASSYSGSGAAIDLSGTSLTFSGTNTLDAGTGSVLLPAPTTITGTLPTITGTTCYDSTHIISGDVSSIRCYDDDITTNIASAALTITDRIWSLSNRIDLSGATGSITLNGAILEADGYTDSEINSIDLSGASSLTFMGTNTLDAGSKGIFLPSGFRVSGIAPTITGTVSHATESGAYIISSTPITFPASANNDITTSLSILTISHDLTSVVGKIDLTGAGTALTINSVALTANSYSGSDAAVDLSEASALTFTGTNSIDVGSGYALLPASDLVTGTIPAVTGVLCYNSPYTVVGGHNIYQML